MREENFTIINAQGLHGSLTLQNEKNASQPLKIV